MNKISRLQDNMALLRKLSNWTAKDLATILDVSPQTISNLENKTNNTKLSKIQYLAIRSVFEAEAIKSNNKPLINAISVLVDDDAKLSDKEYLELSEKLKALSSMRTSQGSDILSSLMAGLIPIIPFVGISLLGLAFDDLLRKKGE